MPAEAGSATGQLCKHRACTEQSPPAKGPIPEVTVLRTRSACQRGFRTNLLDFVLHRTEAQAELPTQAAGRDLTAEGQQPGAETQELEKNDSKAGTDAHLSHLEL